jgi:thiosulfate/3-mercaptopyruvate sulfurtransferase
LEVWEKVLVNAEALAGTVHGYIACTKCHGGSTDGITQDMAGKYAAHEGIVRDPSIDAQAACGDCHTDIAPYQSTSLHNNLAGYDTVLYARSVPENHATIEEGEAYHCNNCHTTCGQCHISQPTSVGGGLINGHVYNRTPSMSRQCTACHGSRVKNEYTGAHEGIPADVHLRSARMVCTDCHTAGDMHGTDYIETGIPDHRYAGEQGPSCESCHAEQSGIGSGNAYHDAHGTEVLSCQTCHSVSYINCYDCHLERTEEDVPYFRLGHEEMGFYIARNPLRNRYRPYRYVPVRHVPTWPGLFDLYGEDVLNNFDNLPTWTYATPHNIQRITPQTESCEACHNSTRFFLTADKVRPEELSANAELIIVEPPAIPKTYQVTPTNLQTLTNPTPSTDPLDAGPASVDPLDAASSSTDPLDAPVSVDPLDAPVDKDPLDAPASGSGDPLDAPPAATSTPDPLDA